jgi:hypothetical protein
MVFVVLNPVAEQFCQFFIKRYFIMGIMVMVMMVGGHGLTP